MSVESMGAGVTGVIHLRGRNALITGGAGGIGAGIARHFVAAGAQIYLTDARDDVREVARSVGAAGSFVGDMSDAASVAACVRMATESLSCVDVLVAAHGIAEESPILELTETSWRRTIETDLTSVFFLAQAVLPGMLDKRNGRIIAIASQLALKGGDRFAHYAAAKAGVIGFVKSLAREVSGRGVLVNAIAPGPIETPMMGSLSPEWICAKRAELPLGRFGTVDEVAPAAVLLASDPGGNIFTGQILGPNSGDVMP